jgi:hypothetical protein
MKFLFEREYYTFYLNFRDWDNFNTVEFPRKLIFKKNGSSSAHHIALNLQQLKERNNGKHQQVFLDHLFFIIY